MESRTSGWPMNVVESVITFALLAACIPIMVGIGIVMIALGLDMWRNGF